MNFLFSEAKQTKPSGLQLLPNIIKIATQHEEEYPQSFVRLFAVGVGKKKRNFCKKLVYKKLGAQKC